MSGFICRTFMAVPKHFLCMTDFKTLGSCALESMQLSSSTTDTCLQGEMDLFDPARHSPSKKSIAGGAVQSIFLASAHTVGSQCGRHGPFLSSCLTLALASLKAPSIGSLRSCVMKTLSIRHSSLENSRAFHVTIPNCICSWTGSYCSS